jgi:hypothetical protein
VGSDGWHATLATALQWASSMRSRGVASTKSHTRTLVDSQKE